ncbi:MAG: hypothetical protein KIC46_05955, partial [Clostridiales bacterium]|nr:hypothetical protein [Clostridiales bacterium]
RPLFARKSKRYTLLPYTKKLTAIFYYEAQRVTKQRPLFPHQSKRCAPLPYTEKLTAIFSSAAVMI